ncbi:MAG TPA: tetratricopeptide repeat protein [Methylothermaceae bacterium]|nr:tetratricopeptide repeat protein [Methylothermaceae bacterium]
MKQSGQNRCARLRMQAMQCLQQGRFEHARKLLEELCVLQADDADSWFLLGALYGQAGQMIQAIRCSERALALNPGHVDAASNLGQAYRRVGRYADAERCFRIVVAARPQLAEAYDMLGYVLQEQGRREAAIECYRKALEIKPELEGTAYLLAALLGGEEAPERAPEIYVRGLFDGFADHFEATLVGELGYTPRHIRTALERVLPPKSGGLRVLDLGCGTGLSGLELQDFVRELVGVDLSPRMLERARDKGLYDRLEEADIIGFLRSETRHWDLIVAADVFVYFGELEEVFGLIVERLEPGGLFAFSVEELDSEDKEYCLRPTNRYAHSAAGIERRARASGMEILSCDAVRLRKQKGEDVAGLVYLLRAPGQDG